MKIERFFNVGVFIIEKEGRPYFVAYTTKYYNPDWDGCNELMVLATKESRAKKRASIKIKETIMIENERFFKVGGVFIHDRGERKPQVVAYTRYYSPDWDGCNELRVLATSGAEAKKKAIKIIKHKYYTDRTSINIK